MLAWILGSSVVSLLVALGGASLILAVPAQARRSIVPTFVAYATGTLLGAAFLGMLPTAFASGRPEVLFPAVLGGIIGFFVLEKVVLWRHCHDADCPHEHGRVAPLILIGDAFHNFVDGVVIAGAFLAGTEIGIATAIAVIAHELPQELGDFAILLDAGYAPARALLWNVASGSTVILGAVLAWSFLGQTQQAIPWVLAVAAASFIYIAAADLIPELHRRQGWLVSVRQVLLLLAGVATIVILRHAH